MGKFKIGDRVRCHHDSWGVIHPGHHGTVVTSNGNYCRVLFDGRITETDMVFSELELVTETVPMDEKNQSSSTIFPEDAAERKTYPMYRGLLKYFPNALAAVAHQSYQGNQQHHPDKPLHWDMNKSTDEADAIVRHLMEGDYVAVAWRALALLERVKTNNIKENTL